MKPGEADEAGKAGKVGEAGEAGEVDEVSEAGEGSGTPGGTVPKGRYRPAASLSLALKLRPCARNIGAGRIAAQVIAGGGVSPSPGAAADFAEFA